MIKRVLFGGFYVYGSQEIVKRRKVNADVMTEIKKRKIKFLCLLGCEGFFVAWFLELEMKLKWKL